MDPFDMADEAYERDRDQRQAEGRPKLIDECRPCEGRGFVEDERGIHTCARCEGTGLTDAARRRVAL